MEREERDLKSRHRRRTGRMLITRPVALIACLSAAAVVLPGTTIASERAVEPLMVGSAPEIRDPVPWASPNGEQIISFTRTGVNGNRALGVRARINGFRFGTFDLLSATAGVGAPELAFGPDGAALALWGVAESGVAAEQAVRQPGGPFGPAESATPCAGSVSVAASRQGEVLAACRAESGASPPFSGRVAGAASPGPVSFGDELTPATDDPLLEPFTAWGSNGTSLTAFAYRTAGESGATIQARVTGPDSSSGEEETIGPLLPPDSLKVAGVAVLPDGTAAITAETGNATVLLTREAGAGNDFTGTALAETSISAPRVDQFGRLHFVVSRPTGSGDAPASVRIRNQDGSVGDPIPIPLTGEKPEIVDGGFQVLPNGTEYVVFRNSKGFFFTLRRPGPAAFSPPKNLAPVGPSNSTGSATLTREGDLLLAWRRSSSSGDRLWLGGFDKGHRPVVASISVPKKVREGRAAALSAKVTDPMGLRRITWEVSGGPSAVGEKVRLRFNRAGKQAVTVTAIDRAGNRSIRTRKVVVVRLRAR